MLLTVFLAIVFCGAITLMLISAVAFVQDTPDSVNHHGKPKNERND